MRITLLGVVCAILISFPFVPTFAQDLSRLPSIVVGDTTLGTNELWSDDFAPPGASGRLGSFTNVEITDMTIYRGMLVVTGYIGFMDGVPVPGLATFDGNEWKPFPEGIFFHSNTPPRSIAQFHDKLFAGGWSVSADDNLLYTWDGVAWIPIPVPTPKSDYSVITKLRTIGNKLVVCGYAARLNSRSSRNESFCLKWDGSSWEDAMANAHGSIVEVVEYKNCLYAAGTFSLGADTTKVNIARWDGTNWIPVGNGTNGPVYCLSSFEDRLVAGGHFSKAGETAAINIATWDEDGWHSLGAGLTREIDAWANVAHLAVLNDRLIAEGSFEASGSRQLKQLAFWNGSSWEPFGEGLFKDGYYYRFQSLEIFNDRLIVGGHFPGLGGHLWGHIATWNGQQWSPLLPERTMLSQAPNCFLPEEDGLLAGGVFSSTSDNDSSYRVARWNGTTWTTVTSGVNGRIFALARFNSHLVAAGEFTKGGNIQLNHIAEWDGTSWHPLDSGADNIVFDLMPFQGRLVAAGGFRQAGNQVSAGISFWDGARWHSMGQGISGPEGSQLTYVMDLNTYHGELIASGNFTAVNGVPAHYIARWNGSVWKDLSPEAAFDDRPCFLTGIGCTRVDQTAVWNDRLIASSLFFGSQPSNRFSSLAAWNGSGWTSVIIPSMSNIRTEEIGVYDGKLVICGSFGDGSETDEGYAFLYDGSHAMRMGAGIWSGAIGTTEWPPVTALGSWRGSLYLGGNFHAAGDKPSAFMAQWDGQGFRVTPRKLVLQVSPNPARFSATLTWDLKESSQLRLRVLDLQGREVKTLIDGLQSGGSNSYDWDLKDNAGLRVVPGVYFFQLSTDQASSSQRIIIIR